MTHETTAPVRILADELLTELDAETSEQPTVFGFTVKEAAQTSAATLRREQAPEALLAQPAAPVAVPEGWKLVPVNPTDEMALAYRYCIPLQNRRVYRAMLAAAPTPPAGPWESPCTPPAQPVAWTGTGSLAAIKAGLEGFIWGSPAKAHPVPLYAAPPAQQSQWVPVSERLPAFPAKGKCHVLALEKSNPFPFPVRWTGKRWEYLDGDTARNVTHWMPLPAAPGDTAPPAPEQDIRRIPTWDEIEAICWAIFKDGKSDFRGCAKERLEELRALLEGGK